MGEKGSVLNHLYGFYPPIFGVCSFVNRSYCCTVWLVCFSNHVIASTPFLLIRTSQF